MPFDQQEDVLSIEVERAHRLREQFRVISDRVAATRERIGLGQGLRERKGEDMAKPPRNEPFGSWFRRKLKERDWSQDRAARELDISGATVRNWVRPTESAAPRYEPSYRQLLKVVSVFGELPPEIVKAMHGRRPAA